MWHKYGACVSFWVFGFSGSWLLAQSVLAERVLAESEVDLKRSEIDALFSMSLEELSEIEVSVANRKATPLANTPSSVSVFTAAEIQKMGVRSLEDLLNFVPGFMTTRTDEEGRAYAPVVRGRRSNSVGREILVLYDGLRLNDPTTGGVFVQHRNISLHNVKQVEIIRGPGSSLYGANAFSAVINIITREGETSVLARLGSFDAGEAALLAAAGDDGWAVDLFAQGYKDHGDDYDPFYDFFGQFQPTTDPIQQTDLYLKARVHEFSLAVRRTVRTDHFFVNGGGQSNRLQRHHVDNRSIRARYEQSWSFGTIEYFGEHSKNIADNLLGLFPENPDPALAGNPLYWSDGSTDEMIGGNIRSVKRTRFGLDVAMEPVGSHQINAGLVYRKESVGLNPFQSSVDVDVLESTGALIPSTPAYNIERGFYIGGVRFDLLTPSDRESWGGYIQNAWKPTEKVSITGGIRHDHYQDFGDHTSFRLGMVYRFNNESSFKLLYGDAFRAPSFLETRAGIASGGISNPDLLPEVVKTYEAAWSQRIGVVSATITLFHNDYRDLVRPVLVSDVVPGFTAFQPQNIGTAETNGMETELQMRVGESWYVRGGVSHLFKKIDEEPVADNQGFIIVNYGQANWNANLSTYFHDKVLSRVAGSSGSGRDTYLDAYQVVNLGFSVALIDGLEAQLNVTNLFDESYRTWSPQDGIEGGLPARGRGVLAGFKLVL